MKGLNSFLRYRPIERERGYLVKVERATELNLRFRTYKEAQDYKKLLHRSTRQLRANIVRQEFSNGYMTEIGIR